MNFLNVFFIALGLAMDALAVSAIIGISLGIVHYKAAFKTAIFFGGFQALMPVFGWLSGLGLRDFILGVDHWVAFGLLLFIGSKMIWESFKVDQCDIKKNYLCLSSMLLLSLATSVDAFAVGVGFAFLDMAIFAPVIVIGVVTFVVSFSGVVFGSKIGISKGKKLEIVGGIVLILIGLKIVFENYFF